MEGHPYYDVCTRDVKNSIGIEDEIRSLNRAIKNVATAKTEDELLSFAYDFAQWAPSVEALEPTDDPVSQATINQVRDELLARRRDLKRQAIETIERGAKGEPVPRTR